MEKEGCTTEASVRGGGFEEFLLECAYDRRGNGIRVLQKMIKKKVKITCDEIAKNDEENDLNVNFLPSTPWLQNLMKRYGL